MGILSAIEKFLDGKKTYIVAAVTGIAAVLLSLGKLSQEQFNHLVAIAIPAFFAAIRSAIGNK